MDEEYARQRAALHHAIQLATLQEREGTIAVHRERVVRVKQLIDVEFSQELDLAQMAETACYAPHHFHRVFRSTVGMTPHQYLTRRRIEYARHLLLSTQMDVTSVCMEVGFQSLGSFSTLFCRHTGHSPSHYRRRYHFIRFPERPMPMFPWCFVKHFTGFEQKTSVS